MINCICGVKNKRTDNIGNHYEKTAASGATITKSYYYAGGRRIAMRETTASGTQLSFLLSDHLGSTSITADASGARTAELRYKPWGETRSAYGTTPTTFTFTGQRVESKLGLHFYNARWYDSQLGRFIQADPVVPYPSDPQSWDRFAYVNNNPVRYIDPTGHVLSCGTSKEGCEDDLEGRHLSQIWRKVLDASDPFTYDLDATKDSTFEISIPNDEVAAAVYYEENIDISLLAKIPGDNPINVSDYPDLFPGPSDMESVVYQHWAQTRMLSNQKNPVFILFIRELGLPSTLHENYEPNYLHALIQENKHKLFNAQLRYIEKHLLYQYPEYERASEYLQINPDLAGSDGGD